MLGRSPLGAQVPESRTVRTLSLRRSVTVRRRGNVQCTTAIYTPNASCERKWNFSSKYPMMRMLLLFQRFF
jgi:hypothetical protein